MRHFIALILAASLGGCLADGEGAAPAQTVQAVGSFTVDATGIATAPAPTLPTARLPASAFSESAITGALMQSSEALGAVTARGTRQVRDSTSWHLERDPGRGELLFVRQPDPGAPIAFSDQDAQQQAMQRLTAWGMVPDEMGAVHQRHLAAHAEDDGVLGAPTLLRRKTFVMRAIHGVPVEGHRAVLTYSLDGALRRAMIRWPALAASGHRMRTALTTQQIIQRAVNALTAAGESSGNVTLRWRYVPTLTPAGEAVLTLMVSAHMPAVSGNPYTEEAREIPVDVSATP